MRCYRHHVTIQLIIFLSRLRRELKIAAYGERQIFQIFTNQTNPYGNNYIDLKDLNRFVRFLPDRALLNIKAIL